MTTTVNTLPLRCLVESLVSMIEAEAEERAARDAYDGPSWGYFGHSYIEQRERAAELFGKRLDEYIDSRIEAATGAKP